MRLSLVFPHDLSRPDAIAVVQAADRCGLASVWTGESYGFDAFTTATQVACATTRINIGLGIINMASRSPALIAQSAASLDFISNGRLILGLGSSAAPVTEGWHGVSPERPLRRLREVIDIVRLVLRRERLVYDGEIYHLNGGLRLIDHPVREEIPIYLGSITPSGAALAGEVADGWLLTHVVLSRFEEVLHPLLEVGERRAGRTPGTVKTCASQVPVIVTGDRSVGRDAARARLALYIGGMGTKDRNLYTELYQSYGFEEEAATIRTLFMSGKREEAQQAISDELIDAAAIVGDIEYCQHRLSEFDDAAIDEVAIAVIVPGGGVKERIAALEKLAEARA
jgi:F420-dependent oxidoreductase-like protein